MHIHPRSAEGIRKLYHRVYGKGLGSLLKSGLSAVKSTTKTLANAAAQKGVQLAKSAGTNLKEAAKETLKNGLDSAKGLAAQAVKAALAEGQRIVKEHGVNMVNALANAENFSDIGKALGDTAKSAAQDLKDTASAIARDTVQEAKDRALDLAKQGVLSGVHAGAKTLVDAVGGSDGVDEGGRISISRLLAEGGKRSRKKTAGAIFLPGGSEGKGIYLA